MTEIKNRFGDTKSVEEQIEDQGQVVFIQSAAVEPSLTSNFPGPPTRHKQPGLYWKSIERHSAFMTGTWAVPT